MSALVAGEPADRIMAVLARSQRGRSDDGMATISLTVEPHEVFVFRALMRLEAELLLEDADSLRSGHDDLRTTGQRGADAFALLVERSAEALGLERRQAPSEPRPAA